MSISPGSYFRCVAATSPYEVGDLVLLLSVSNGLAYWASGESRYSSSVGEFLQSFEPAADGAAIRQAEISGLMQQIQEIGQEGLRVKRQLRNFSPHVTSGGLLSSGDGPVPDGSAVARVSDAGRASTPQDLDANIRATRNEVLRVKARVGELQGRLKALVAEQEEALKVQLKGLTDMVQGAEEAIWTISLYLGKSETIVQVADGEPAGEDEPIAIRQMVLYMDEECRIAAEAGGIDVTQIDEFDRWLQVPTNLDQILPNIRGVVAMRVRRHPKEYAEPWVSAVLNEANQATHFLFRNGARVYRLTTDLDVGRTLMPLRNEFENLFYRSGLDGEREELRPGSDAYMRAMKAAEGKQKHYMRVLLMLQGVCDRTPIFRPLPVERINLLSLEDQGRYVVHVADAETETLLGTGRPPFYEWLKGVNAGIESGQRIIGAFRGINADEVTVRPRSASAPPSLQLHTVERRVKDEVQFLYQRSDRIWARDDFEIRDPQRRASASVAIGSRVILAIDRADIGDIEYYLHSRLNRREYVHLVPLLTTAIACKKAEAEAEQPFCTLLAGEIMKRYGVDRDTADAAVPEIVTWWKFKNRTHRALTADDRMALTMIVKEFAVRAVRDAIAEGTDHSDVVAHIRDVMPEVLFIGLTPNGDYEAIALEAPRRPFVRRVTWRNGVRSGLRVVKERAWHLLDGQRLRWTPLYETDEYQQIPSGLSPFERLTGPEIEAALPDVFAAVGAQHGRRRKSYHHRGYRDDIVPLFVALGERDEILVYGIDSEYRPFGRPLTKPVNEPYIARLEVAWVKGRKGLAIGRAVQHQHLSLSYNGHSFVDGVPAKQVCVWRSDDNVAELKEHLNEIEKQRLHGKSLDPIVRFYKDAAYRHLKDAEWDRLYREFMEEYGADDLWEGHKKTLRPQFHIGYVLHSSIQHAVELGEDIAGLSGMEVIEKYGDMPDELSDRDIDPLVREFVFPAWEEGA